MERGGSMIEIQRRSDGIAISGHAHYAPRGQDIVCAAVSTLAQNLIASIEALTVDTIEYSVQSGKIDIKHGNLSEAGQLLVDSFFVGCELVANSYPDNVKLTEP